MKSITHENHDTFSARATAITDKKQREGFRNSDCYTALLHSRETERESAREGGAGIPLSHQVADGPTPRLSFFIANLNESHGSHRALPVASAILGIGLLFSCSL